VCLFDVKRTHLSGRVSNDGRGGVSAFRGGTLAFGAAELRAARRGRDRVSPYVLGGFGAGVSRPHVKGMFPDAVSNDVRAMLFGAGIHVPLRAGLSVFSDVRMIIGAEAGELLAMAPVRAGMACRF